jgi:predicted nucleic acid-binding protein
MMLVDTGFLLALCQPRDDLHSQARSWAAAVSERLLVTEYVLVETFNNLSKPVDRPRAHVLLQQIRSTGGYEIVAASAALFDAGIQFHKSRPDKKWSLTDCISFVVMRQRGITQALAYDRHFEQAGFEALLRRDPP